jgi:outer membrane protein OmpA-like peptidoglycan-associated protein
MVKRGQAALELSRRRIEMAYLHALRANTGVGRFVATSLIVCGTLLASGTALAQSAAPAAPPTPVPFEEALLNAANGLFSKANLQGAPDRVPLVIDPLIDGFTAGQSAATQSMERRIADLVRSSYRRFELLPFTAESIDKKPMLLIGTFTAINQAGVAGGARDVYRICLALADLKENKIVSKGHTRALPQGIDTTPIAFFDDSPAFVKDRATDGYIKSCQASRLGDPLDPGYADRIRVAVHINDGIQAYGARKYAEALDHYHLALRSPGGEQLRVYNGLYLANWKLNRREAAREAFDRIVDYGLDAQRLAVKFLFRPNAAQFSVDTTLRPQYDMWVQEIAKRTTAADKCLEVSGHTSATGAADLNERLSLQRAEYVRDGLLTATPSSKGRQRYAAKGVGSRELIVGTAKDDASDALDRRVEFNTVPCATVAAAGEKATPGKSANKPGVTRSAAGDAPKPVKEPGARPRIGGGDVPGQVRRYLRRYGLGDVLD